jgi:L-fucose mutarotase
MLFLKCIHPQILGALAKMGHGSKVLISDGGYPHITECSDNAEIVYLTLTPGMVLATDVLKVIIETVPIEKVTVMTPPDESDQPIFKEISKVIPELPIEKIKQYDFYDMAKQKNVYLVIATGDTRNYANILLTLGFIKHPEGRGNY